MGYPRRARKVGISHGSRNGERPWKPGPRKRARAALSTSRLEMLDEKLGVSGHEIRPDDRRAEAASAQALLSREGSGRSPWAARIGARGPAEPSTGSADLGKRTSGRRVAIFPELCRGRRRPLSCVLSMRGSDGRTRSAGAARSLVLGGAGRRPSAKPVPAHREMPSANLRRARRDRPGVHEEVDRWTS
jgi:hypothetical protein